MNLFDLHKQPSPHKKDKELIPKFAWKKYHANPEELKKREDMWAKDAEYAYLYARGVIKGPFPKGEDAIATNVPYSCAYSYDILKGPFPKGEDAISKDPWYSLWYAKDVLKGPFPKGEDAIAGDKHWNKLYKQFLARMK